MSNDQVWMPCPLCRSGNNALDRDHWRSFETESGLRQHLKDNLKDLDDGKLGAIVADWRQEQRYKSWQTDACSDPMKSLNEMFEKQIVRKGEGRHGKV